MKHASLIRRVKTDGRSWRLQSLLGRTATPNDAKLLVSQPLATTARSLY